MYYKNQNNQIKYFKNLGIELTGFCWIKDVVVNEFEELWNYRLQI